MAELSVEIMVKALDALVLRSAATAENIANIGARGYRPGRVQFENALAAAAERGLEPVRAFKAEIVREDPGEPGSNLGAELITTTGTAGRFGAIAEVMSRQFQLHTLAVSRSR